MSSFKQTSLSAAEIHAKSIRDGQAIIVKRFGSVVAETRYGITSSKHVPSPAEKLDIIAERAAQAALKAFAAKSKAKPAKAAAKPPVKASVKTASQKYFGKTVHKFYAGSFCG